jgi:hypothetical protein
MAEAEPSPSLREQQRQPVALVRPYNQPKVEDANNYNFAIDCIFSAI